jgi:hypothetical protein
MPIDTTPPSQGDWQAWAERQRQAYLALEAAAIGLHEVAARRVHHAGLGLCPDALEGYDSRDPDCQACRALMAADPLVRA